MSAFRLSIRPTIALAAGAFLNIFAATGDLASWRFVQEVAVPEAGLVRLALPPATLGAAQPNLADLRLLDAQNREVPYAIERLLPEPARVAGPRTFNVSLLPNATQISIETGFTQAVESVTLQTTAPSFIKAVRVEGSTDGSDWTVLARGAPIFRQAGSSQLEITIRPARWAWLRLTVDDQRSPPVGFSGALLRAAAAETPAELLAADIVARAEMDGNSLLTVRLPAANLYLAAIDLEASDLLFTREVTILALQVGEYATNEMRLGSGTIYRLELDGQLASSNLSVRVEAPAPSRHVIVRIRNQDSPPLAIAGLNARVRPASLIFRAATAGRYRLFSGNSDCAVPRYDLAALPAGLAGLPAIAVRPGPVADNQDFRLGVPLPGVQDTAAALDVAKWRFRKPVKAGQAGVQRLELDLETLAFARSDLGDLRLVRADKQVPFLRDTVSGVHRVTPEVSTADDPKRPGISRWRLKLPYPRLPLARLNCSSPTPLFQRHMELYEEMTDERGIKYRRRLDAATWSRTPGEKPGVLSLAFVGTPETDVLFLETSNGDNPSIVLEEFALEVPAPRILFKLGESADDLFLYYGNHAALTPSYDLSLVSTELRAAPKVSATLGAVEQLKPGGGWRFGGTGTGGPLLWIVLAVVGGTLLVLIVRLLPKPAEPAAGGKDDGQK